MFSSARSLFFRVVERETLSSSSSSTSRAAGKNHNRSGGRRKFSSSSMNVSDANRSGGTKFHPNQRTSAEHKRSLPVGQSFRSAGALLSASGDKRPSNNSFDTAQRRFESKWRGTIDNEEAKDDEKNQRAEEEKLKTSNTFSRLSRDDAIAAKADQLRREHVSDAGIDSPKSFPRLSMYADERKETRRKRSLPSDRKAALRQMRDEILSDDRFQSTVEVTDGDENDDELLDLNRLSPRHTAISGRSALAKNVLLRHAPQDSVASAVSLDSRKARSTWDAIDTSQAHVETILDDVAARSSDREWDNSEGHYRHTFDSSVNLEHQRDAVQHSKSIYSHRALPLPGLWSYHSFVTPLEEKNIVAELMRLLLKPATAFHAEEGRYCVNLFEKRLGSAQAANVAVESELRDVRGKRSDVLAGLSSSASAPSMATSSAPVFAHSIADDAPALHRVLLRAARAELIPSMPNVVQVSEMVSAFAGYPPHLKHPSIGSYFGILNLVSNAQLDLVHVDQPWAPKVMLVPRGLFVFEPEIFRNFRAGYLHLDRQWTTHQEASRFTKDYRIEVMFATVDAEMVPRLEVPVRVTEYAEKKMHEQQEAKANKRKRMKDLAGGFDE